MGAAERKTISLFYLYIFILVLFLVGNIIQNGTSNKMVGWLVFSMCTIFGIIAMLLLWVSRSYRFYMVPILNVIIAALLMFAMIYSNPSSTLNEKIQAHFANICFLIIVSWGLYMAHADKDT